MQVATHDLLDQAQAVIAGLLDPAVAVAVCDPRQPQPAVLPEEQLQIASAVPSRQAEFAAGRAAARAAMRQLGVTPVAIPMRADRAPKWPAGLRGSISHTSSLCAAAVTNGGQLIGLDVEHDSDLLSDLLPTVCSALEQSRIAGPAQARLAKLIFSAKEAAYKAQYPASGLLFGFDHLDVTLDLPNRTFTATFLHPAVCFAAGDRLHGRFDHVAGHIVTAVSIPQVHKKGA